MNKEVLHKLKKKREKEHRKHSKNEGRLTRLVAACVETAF